MTRLHNDLEALRPLSAGLLGLVLLCLPLSGLGQSAAREEDPMDAWVDPPRPAPDTVLVPLDPNQYRRPDGTLPAWTSNFDRFHATIAAELGFSAPTEDDTLLRAQAHVLFELVSPLNADYRDHDRMFSLYLMVMDYADTSLLGYRSQHSQWGVLAPGIQFDSRWVGARLAIKAATLHDELAAICTPLLGLRLGEAGHPMGVVFAHFGGLWLWADTSAQRSVLDNLDLRLELELPLDAYLHLQLRARFRDWLSYESRDDWTFGQRELYAVLGAELSGAWFGRSMPGFLGLGVRTLLASEGSLRDDDSGSGTGLFVLLEADLGLYAGNSTLW